jgi:acetyl esterase
MNSLTTSTPGQARTRNREQNEETRSSTRGRLRLYPSPPAVLSLVDVRALYPIDHDMQALLDAHAALKPLPIETLQPNAARRQPCIADAMRSILKQQGRDSSPMALAPGVTSFDEYIPGPVSLLPIRVYMPAGIGPFPVVVYFHGGGWVLGDKNVYDGSARGIAKHANAIVVSVDYRLAPKAKFPAQYDDALAAYRWVCRNAAAINGDPHYLALAGEGAGGNLALATAIAALDQGLTPPLHVLAIYPLAQAAEMLTPSLVDSAHAKPLTKAMLGWFADNVFATPDARHDPRINLVDADLRTLPPVTLINARIDPLRSDGDMLAAALQRAGIPVQHITYEGVMHDFFGMAAVVAKANEAQRFAGEQLMKSLARFGAF